MSAADRFRVGDRVNISEVGRAHLESRRSVKWKWLATSALGRATVVGFSKKYPDCMYVVRDGYKSRECYHATWWDLMSRPVVQP